MPGKWEGDAKEEEEMKKKTANLKSEIAGEAWWGQPFQIRKQE